MNINQESDYALRLVLMLSKEGLDNKLDAKFLSEKTNIPLRFLLKLTRCIHDNQACSTNKIGHFSIHHALGNIQNTLVDEL